MQRREAANVAVPQALFGRALIQTAQRLLTGYSGAIFAFFFLLIIIEMSKFVI